MPNPTYRQRLTGVGTTGVAAILAAPLVYLAIWSSWTASDLWMIVPAMLLIIGPILVLIGREYYDPNSPEEVEARAIAAERIRLQKIKG